MNKCQLNEGPFYQCCCQCIFHAKTVTHCTTVNRKVKEGICQCGVHTGYVCAMPLMTSENEEEEFVYDNWPEHSAGCCMYTPRKEDNLRRFKRLADSFGFEEVTLKESTMDVAWSAKKNDRASVIVYYDDAEELCVNFFSGDWSGNDSIEDWLKVGIWETHFGVLE